MPRKKTNIPENYNAPLPSRLRELMKSTGRTQAELASHLGISRQSVSAYADGSANPTPTAVVSIAHFFNVSTDYLLGESPVNSRDANIQSVCQYTKLSEDAVKRILDLQETEAFLDNHCSVSMAGLLSMVLENSCFVPMMEDFQLCLNFMYEFEQKRKTVTTLDRQIISDAISDLRKRTKADFVLLPDYEISNYYRSQVKDFCGQLITSIIGNYRKQIQDRQEASENGKPQDND